MSILFQAEDWTGMVWEHEEYYGLADQIWANYYFETGDKWFNEEPTEVV